MKKIFAVLLALALLVGVSCEAMAVTESATGGSSLNKVRAYTIINNAVGSATTAISPTSYIIPGKCEIVGWHINPTSLNSEGVASLRDALTGAAPDTYIINEAEGTSTIPYDQIFPEGIEISRGVVVNQGPYTSVTVYYKQVRP